VPASDELKVICELLTEKLPSPEVNDYVKGRVTEVIATADSPPRAGRPVRRSPRPRRSVSAVVQQRRRRLVLRSLAGAVATLAAGAVALVAVVRPGAHYGGTGGSAVNTAYVVRHIDSALSAADPAAIAQMTVTTGIAPGSRTEEWSYASQWRSLAYSSDGRLDYDDGFSAVSMFTLVSYLTRTWAHQPGLGRPAMPVFGSRSCESVVAALPGLFQYGLPAPGLAVSSLPVTVAGALRAAISCGALAAAGRQRVDGIETIELTSRPDSLIAETVWVNSDTYLPVRVAVRSAPGGHVLQTANISWLLPTAQNLARLSVPIPARFRPVPLAQALDPLLHQFPQPKGGSTSSGSGPEYPGHSPP
jgi:hypothetical protein